MILDLSLSDFAIFGKDLTEKGDYTGTSQNYESNINECIEAFHIRGHGHSLTIVQGHSHSSVPNTFDSKPLCRLNPNLM